MLYAFNELDLRSRPTAAVRTPPPLKVLGGVVKRAQRTKLLSWPQF